MENTNNNKSIPGFHFNIKARFFILLNFDKELEHLILNQIEAFNFKMNKNVNLGVASPRPR